jgi:hypothetical protein
MTPRLCQNQRDPIGARIPAGQLDRRSPAASPVTLNISVSVDGYTSSG